MNFDDNAMFRHQKCSMRDLNDLRNETSKHTTYIKLNSSIGYMVNILSLIATMDIIKLWKRAQFFRCWRAHQKKNLLLLN